MGLFSGITDYFGSFLNSITGVNSQMDKSFMQQNASMDKQNAYNSYMWNLQNQYNSPVAQLARMKEAGIDINPTSYALGTGNLSNTAAFVGSENGFAGSGSPAGNPISMALGVATGLKDIAYKDAMTDSVKTNTKNLKNFLSGKGNSTFNPQIEKVADAIPTIIKKGSKRIENAIKRVDDSLGLTDRMAKGMSMSTRIGEKIGGKVREMTRGKSMSNRLGEKIYGMTRGKSVSNRIGEKIYKVFH